MIVVMHRGAGKAQVRHVVDEIHRRGFKAHLSRGIETTIIGVIGDERKLSPDVFQVLDGVERVVRVLNPFKLASLDFQPHPTTVPLPTVTVGGRQLAVAAGPCAVESREQLRATARAVKGAGATLLRGGAFKPRTSPYSFQGMGREGLKLLKEIRAETGLPVVTEVMGVQEIDAICDAADLLQVGARNMQNFDLLKAVGKVRKPVLLKRGMMSTLEELLMSAEYILAQGNHQVILCERGIRTFEKYTRNTFDVSAIPVLKTLTHLPVLVDPSHAAGDRRFVRALALAGIAAGADGLILEVHPDPEKALSDGPQALTFPMFAELMDDVRKLAPVVDRTLEPETPAPRKPARAARSARR